MPDRILNTSGGNSYDPRNQESDVSSRWELYAKDSRTKGLFFSSGNNLCSTDERKLRMNHNDNSAVAKWKERIKSTATAFVRFQDYTANEQEQISMPTSHPSFSEILTVPTRGRRKRYFHERKMNS